MGKTKDRLFFTYTECNAGWITFSLSYNQVALEYPFSCVFSNPDDLISWAEDVYQDKYSEFACCAEGWSWYFDYDGSFFTVSDDYCNDSEDSPEKRQRLRIAIPKDELCAVIYKALKDFQKSGLYIPREWEPLSFKKAFTDVFGDPSAMLDTVAAMTHSQILAAMQSHYGPASFPVSNFDLLMGNDYSKEYDSATISKRLGMLQESLDDTSDYLGFSGTPILQIHSDLLERLV